MKRLVMLLLAAAIACGNQNVQTDSFATMREAQERGALDRGWLPAWLPSGAYELRAAYDTDGSRRWGILNFRPEDADALRARLTPQELSLEGTRISIPPRIEWWPVALRDELNRDDIAATGLSAYRSRAGDLVFAVNWNQGRAYYWTVVQ